MASRGHNSEFGKWIREERMRDGRSQKELAETAGISQQLWSKMERQGYLPTDVEVKKICKALQKDVQEVLNRRHDLGVDIRGETYKRQKKAFHDHLRSLTNENMNTRVDVFAFHAEALHVDEATVNWIQEILEIDPVIVYTILFRFLNTDRLTQKENLAHNMRMLQRALLAKKSDGSNVSRIRAFARHPSRMEDIEKAMPSIEDVPTLVVPRQKGTSTLHLRSIDPEVQAQEQGKGLELSKAKEAATSIVQKSERATMEFLLWIGDDVLEGKAESESWVPLIENQSERKPNE